MKMNKEVLNVLVTGANGYIGMRLIPKLVENGHKVYCAVRNPERLSINPDLLKKVKIITIDFLNNPKVNFIPKEYESDFYLHFLEANSYILPHSDSGPTAVINLYVETNNCVTQFYEIKDNAQPYQIGNQTDGYVYNLDDLIEMESFIAQPGDVYILNVNKVHSVIPFDNREINRKAICFSTSLLSFNEVERIFT